ncbi:hypothetical protein HGA34_01260 [Candidatus Falkowbacteria bacterium]|nr:hypothetical protein [Candidatus Falkowbacteria bacterium]
MKKYAAIIKTSWLRQFAYRTDILGYRLANLFDILFQMAIWYAVFQTSSVVNGYTFPEMMTYVIIGWLFSFLTANFGLETVVNRDIRDGTLNNFLTKPISYLKYMVVLSIGRASLALFSGVVVQAALIISFHGFISAPPSLAKILLIILIVFIGYFIRLFLSILIGLLSFWVTENAGLNSFFNVLIRFLSGGYAPLSILPTAFYQLSLAFPFAYIIFFPAQLYLDKATTAQGIRGLAIELAWLAALYILIKITWKRGLRNYEGTGA